jgi:membrane protein YqaA with SNARE-associated domain
MPQIKRITVQRTAALLIFLAITAAALLLNDSLVSLGRYGYLGVFLASLIGSATIILPMPAFAVTFAMGGTLPSPLLVGLLAGLGAGLGELVGYLAGYGGRGIVENRESYDWIVRQMARFGGWFIFAAALTPNPAFDVAGIAAGALRFPVSGFLLACIGGKTIRMVLLAYAGAGLLPQFVNRLASLLSSAV